ncbi:MAG: AAA family ATPase [Bacteroidales bacterium]|nr:AAA family ATPase [Bacteroidales bacterium]
MLYHNPKNYARDCDAVAGFVMISTSDTSSECLTACTCIRGALAEGDGDAVLAYGRVLEDNICVSGEAAVILAVLVADGGYARSAGWLAQRCGLEQDRTESVLSDLFDGGLVNQLEDAPGIILSAQAIEMLRRDSTLEGIMQEEFMDVLRYDSDSEDPFDHGTIAEVDCRMREYMEKYPGSRMGRFYEENAMSGLSQAEFRQFVFLCRDFVLRFTAGCKADRGSAAVKAMVNRGWAILFAAQGDSDSDMIKQNNMLLSVGVCKRLFAGMEELIDFSSIMGQTRVIRWNEIDEKPLFYNAEDTEGIERLYRMAGEKEFRRIAGALKAHRLKVAVSGILYGDPGTGKTELAKQIARTTRRNLIAVDASKTVGSYVGESERNYRDLFRNFRYIEAVSQRAPIMFIDEADGILGKRIPGGR